MQTVVNNFANSSANKRVTIEEKIKEKTGKEKMKELFNKVKAEIPPKEEIIKRFGGKAQTIAEQKLANTQFALYKQKLDNAKNKVLSVKNSVDNIIRLIQSAETFVGIIDNILSAIQPLIDIFDNIVKVIGKALSILPPQVLSGAVVLNFLTIMDKMMQRVEVFKAIVKKAPIMVKHNYDELTSMGGKLHPVMEQINKASEFVDYNVQIADLAYEKYLESSNVLGEFTNNEGEINEDALADNAGAGLNDSGSDLESLLDDTYSDPEITGKG